MIWQVRYSLMPRSLPLLEGTIEAPDILRAAKWYREQALGDIFIEELWVEPVQDKVPDKYLGRVSRIVVKVLGSAQIAVARKNLSDPWSVTMLTAKANYLRNSETEGWVQINLACYKDNYPHCFYSYPLLADALQVAESCEIMDLP